MAGEFSLSDQFREYAAGNDVVRRQLQEHSGLAFACYTRRECMRCGLRYSAPMVAPGGDWYSYAYNALNFHAEARWEFDAVLGTLRPSDRVGEIGCGVGVFLDRVRTRGVDSLGLDFSESSIAECKRKHLNAELIDVELDDVNVSPDRTAIASFHVLEHLADPGHLFALARRWAVPGAALWIAVPSDRWLKRLKNQRSPFDEPPHHLTQWTEDSLRRLGDANGWQLDHLIYEAMGFRKRLWTLSTDTHFYRRVVNSFPGRSVWIDRACRYLLYPLVGLSQIKTLAKLSGLSMLAKFRRRPTQ